MAIKTWIGPAAGVWATAGYWSPSGIPASTDDIVFTGDASPTISTTARTCANLTINGGTVSIGGTAAFTITGTITNNGSFTLPAAPTIQGSIVNNNYMETTTSATITVSGGNFQTWALGSHNFHSLTLNKTAGTELRLDGALNLLRSTTSTFNYTAGNLNQNGNSISCRQFTENGTTARTWNMNAVVDITPSGTAPLSINDTTITFSNKNTFTISPQSGTTTLTVTGMGGSATTALCATAVRSNNPSIALYTNLNDGSYRNWTLLGFWEAVTINGNFLSSYFGYWTDINGTYTTALQGTATAGSEVSVFALLTNNNTTTWNYHARVYRITTAAGGVAAGTVLTNAQFTNYAWNWWDGGPIGRAVVYDLACQYATHNLLIDGNWNTWVTYTLNCSGANSTYNLEYVRDNSTSTTIALSATNTTYNLKDVDILGTINHTLGTVQLSTSWQQVKTRAWTTSGGNRHINFANQYIVINGNHRSGTNGTGTISTSSQTASTTLTTDSPTAGGGFLCQTNGAISIGTTWAVTSLPHITIESLADAALLQTSSAIYARTLTVNNAVSFGSSGSPITVYITHNITWNGNSPAAHTLFRYCNLNYYGQNENTTIDCRPYNDPTNVNYRFNSVVTSTTAGTSTVNWNIYALTFSWTRPGGTCTIQDVYLTSTCTLSPASGTNTFNVDGPLNTTSLALSASGTCNATYNVNSLTATTLTPFNTSISCAGAGTGTIVYNINDINLVGANTSNRLLFDGIGTLNVGSNVRLAYFNISNTTVSRTLNFGTNWIKLKTGAIISCAMTTTSVTTTTAKTSFSGAGGFRIFEGNTGTLTTSGITEANAFNLLFDGAYTATLSAAPAWRNIVTSIDSYFGGGGGYFTNTATTFTIYGDLLVRSGENQSIPTNWALHTFNLAGTDSNVPQFISTSAWNSILPLTTVSCTGASPKIFNQWAHGSGTTYIKTLTTDIGTTLVIHKGEGLACDTINVGGGNFDCFGTIYCNRWNPTGNTYYWTGSGYLNVGSGVSFSARGGPAGWASSTLYNTNSATAGGTGPNFILKGLDVVNEGSTISYASGTHKVKNLLLSNTTSVGGTAFSVSRGIIYNNGNLTSGGTVTGGNYLYNSSVSSYEGTNFTMTSNTTFSAVSNFCSILWNLPPADGNTYYFEWTMPGQTSPAFQIGVQEPPTRQGAYHSGTSGNGNGGLAINTTLTAANTYWFKINTSAKTYAYGTANTGSGTTVSFSSLANPQYFGIYDGTSAASMTNIAMNFGIASWAYPAQQSGNYYLGSFTQAPPVLNFETGIAPNNRRFITTTSNMSGNTLPLTISSSLNAELDILPTSQNLKVNTLAFNNSSTVRTNNRTIETAAITSGTLEADASAITITGGGTVFDNKNMVNGTPAANNYSYYFDSTNAITIAQTSANAINISNTPFTLECWLWPEESYDTPWVWPENNGSSNTSVNPRLSLISKTTSTDPRSWSRDWELGLQPYTGIPQFYNGTNFYTGNTGVNEDGWNHIAVTFTGAGQGNQGGGGDQDGASLFDGKPEYRGRSGTTVGSTAIAAPQTLPVTNYWSCYFDGTDDRLNIADSTKSHVGSAAFTLELWVYNTAFDPSGNMLFEKGRFSVGKEIRAYMTATQVVFEGNLTATATGTYTTVTATTTNALNTWYHLAFIRSANTLYIFRNGSLLTSAAFTGTIFNTTEAMTIGPADGNNNFMVNGYISNVRLITGQALTTTSYTVPTSPLTKTSTGWAGVSLTGTVALLTCNSNQFVDNSDNPAVVSFGGGIPQLASFSPFGSTYNGSVVFNNANYLQAPYSSDLDLSTGGDWTVECWFTLPNVTSNTAHSLIGMSNGAGQVNKWLLNVNMSTGFAYQANRVGFVTVIGGVNQWINASYTWESGKWYHIAAVYTSSDTTIRLYVNGLCLGLVASNVSATTGVLRVGSDGESYRYFNGYIKDARIVKGTAVYQTASVGQLSSTAIPTQPLTAITNTKILLCQGNGYFDSNTQLTPKTITITGATSTRLEEVSPFYTPNTTASNSFIPTTTLPTTLAYQGPLQGGSPPVNGYGAAGGGGYWGGSGGGYSESNTMAGGGGGSSYTHPTLVTSSAIYNGNYTTPGNSSDADRGTSGNAGAVNTAGQDGKLIITYGATTLTYSTAQFNTAWTCPAGVTTISVKAWGAGGAGGTVGGWGVGFTGGAGACVTGTVSVNPGNIYYLTVGGGGQVNSTTSAIGGGGVASRNNGDNRYGSGGGGYTGIFTSSPATQASALIVAGGGGGGGSSRNTQQLAIYLNGTAIMREATMTNVTHTDTTQFIIGKYISGYIKDVRVVKNAVVYNGTYTVPSAPLGIHSSGSTELLTCQTNAFEDLSTTPKTIVSSGTTVRRLFSPTAIENTSQITFTGSSDATAYITGSGSSIINNIQYTLPSSSNGPVANSYSVLHDSLTQLSTLQANAATQTLSLQNENFTIECWLYPIRWNTMSSSGHVIATTMASSPTYGWAVSFQPTAMDFTVYGTSGTTTSATYTFSLNTWYHLVWQRTSNGMEFYVNGQLVTNNAPTNRRLYSGGNDSAPLSFGNYIQNLTYRGNGSWRISNFRIVKNDTVYNSGNFTPALPTVTANTVFLGLNTDTFTDQAGTVSYFNVLGTEPTILSNYGYNGTGELTIKTAAFSDSTSPIVSSISQGAGSYSKYFKFNNAIALSSEGLNADLFTRFWNNSSVYYMTNFGGLGSGFGHGPMINSSYIYTRTSLPAHTHIRYKCYWHQTDSVDGETNWLEIDGIRYLEFTRGNATAGATTNAINLLNTFSWSTREYSYSPLGAYIDGFFTIDTGQIAHTSSSISVNHFSGVNQAQTDEAAYLSHVELILYNNGIEVPTTGNIILNVNNFSIDGNASYNNWLQGALKQPSNTSNMVFNYLNIRNSQVTGGLNPYWTAANSTDYGLNSGWNFGAAPSSIQDKSFFFFIVT